MRSFYLVINEEHNLIMTPRAREKGEAFPSLPPSKQKHLGDVGQNNYVKLQVVEIFIAVVDCRQQIFSGRLVHAISTIQHAH